MDKIFLDKKYNLNLPSKNNFSSRKEWEEACWCAILKFEPLLELLMTTHERHNLVMRAAALNGIFSGKSYRQISKETYLSLQTIGVVKKTLNEGIYRSYLERSKKDRKKRRYSSSPQRPSMRTIRNPRRTKYGIVYLP